jgi:hypothetical protein
VRPRYAYPHPEVRRRARSAGAVVLAQTGGVTTVRWSHDPAWLTIATREPVAVRRERPQ